MAALVPISIICIILPFLPIKRGTLLGEIFTKIPSSILPKSMMVY
jgi:hypothetical protein